MRGQCCSRTTLPTGLKIAAPAARVQHPNRQLKRHRFYRKSALILCKNGRFRSVDLLYWIAVLFWGWRVILLQKVPNGPKGGLTGFRFSRNPVCFVFLCCWWSCTQDMHASPMCGIITHTHSTKREATPHHYSSATTSPAHTLAAAVTATSRRSAVPPSRTQPYGVAFQMN